MKKTLLLLLLTLAVAVSLAACKNDDNTLSGEADTSETAQEELEDPWDLPELEGYEKQVQQNLVMYSSLDATIIISSLETDQDIVNAMADQQADAEILKAERDAILGALSGKENIPGTFEQMGNQTVLTASVQLESERVLFYKLLVGENTVFNIMATERDGDISDVLQRIVEALGPF